LQLVLSWPVRIIVGGLLIFALVIDAGAYIYRYTNHIPLGAPLAAGQTPNVLGIPTFIQRGLDLSGGTSLRLKLTNFPPNKSRSDVQQATIGLIQKRVNALGVNEPVITPVGNNNDQIEVQLAGISADKAQQVIGNTARLITTTWVKDPTVKGGPEPGYRPEMTALLPDMLTSATASLDQTNGWVIDVAYNSTGAGIFSDITTKAYNACPTSSCPERFVANWLDLTPDEMKNWAQNANTLGQPYGQGGKLLVNANIIQPITGGQSQISGSFTQSSARDLALLLNAGALPVDIHIDSFTEVGASLGADSVKASLIAGLVGLIVVMIFMIAFYRLPGALASIALLCYAGLLLAIFKALGFTVTLPGLAGFILSVGMAVDANVLIFERFKEETRAGRTVGAAVDAAVRRAWPAIRDSNISTLITTIILYFATQGAVKGFALTLMIGVLCSLISSIIITHNLLAIVLNFGWARQPAMLGVARVRA
jgi:protein-export membrane protein SecD